MFLFLEIFIRTLVLLFQFLYLYMICDNYFISDIFKYLRMNVSKLFRKVRPSLSLWNLAQPLTLYFTWTTCVCSFSLPLASALSLQYNYSGWKATQKLLCQIAWNKTLNLRNCAKITCHPFMQYFQTFLISIDDRYLNIWTLNLFLDHRDWLKYLLI